MTTSLDCLFEPLRTGSLSLKNRLFMAPMATGFDLPTLASYFAARARGGVALITTGEASVHPSGRTGLPNELRMESEDDVMSLRAVASAIRLGGAAAILQLNHAGRYAPGSKLGMQPVAPSPIMSGYTGETPRELSTGEVEGLLAAFVSAALGAQKAGFDGIELLASSGYLLSQFLSPLTNKRTDKYGGSRANRSHLLVTIVEEVRRATGSDFNICVKLDAEDGIEGGIALEDSKALAPALVVAGADRLNVWAGWHESPRPMLPHFVPPAAFLHLAAELKSTVRVPVATVGRITDPHLAACIVREGKADLVGIGRALLADPDFVAKARNAVETPVRPCIGCCHCFDQIVAAVRTNEPLELKCAVNPTLGREVQCYPNKAKGARRVAVVGGGPAGLEAACVAATRGHRVTVYDRAARLGGMLAAAAIPPHKDGLNALIAYYERRLRLLDVAIRLETAFDGDVLHQTRPDVVVLAAGARSRHAAIEGIDRVQTLTAIDVLYGREKSGHAVVVIGGGMIGLETAEYLALAGHQVTVIEMGQIGTDMSLTSRNAFVLRLRKMVRIYSSTRALAIREGGVLVSDPRSQQRVLSADTVVLAIGLEADRDLVDVLTANGVEFYLVGSCKVPGLIDEAVADGFRVGCAL